MACLPLIFFLTLVILPPFPNAWVQLFSTSISVSVKYNFFLEGLNGYFVDEYIFQTYLALFGFFGAIVLQFLSRWKQLQPLVLVTALQVVAALVGSVCPAWALWQVELILNDLYGRPIQVGIGVYFTLIGYTMVWMSVLIKGFFYKKY